MQDFQYEAPATLAQALELLAGGGARCLAGGTDLVLALDRGRMRPRLLVDLKRIPRLGGIDPLPSGGLRIGAATTMAAIGRNAGLAGTYPALAAAARFVGGPAIRNRATLGGNLCNASPAADTATPLVAFNAQAIVTGRQGERRVPLRDFWVAPGETRLLPGEILSAVELPALGVAAGCAFQRLSRTAMDIALVSAAANVALDAQGGVASAVLALGAVGPTVILVPGIAETLRGRRWDAACAERVSQLARDASLARDDVRASSAYRTDQCGILARRAMAQAIAAAEGGRS